METIGKLVFGLMAIGLGVYTAVVTGGWFIPALLIVLGVVVAGDSYTDMKEGN
jgi:hypothetical protein